MCALRLLVCALLLLLLRSLASRLEDADYHALQSSIAEVREGLDSALGDADQALLWTQLGALLHFKDVRYHESGMETRAQALDAYERAVAAALNGGAALRRVRMVALHKKGMLLKMMGRGAEARGAHDEAHSLATSDSDRSVALQFSAAAATMQGDALEGSRLYQRALVLAPTQLGIYLPLVECLKELGLGAQQWESLYEQMLDAETEEGGDKEEGDLSFEYRPGASAEYHWALFLAADKAGRFAQAWSHLRTAHGLLLAAGPAPAPAAAFEQSDRIVRTFVPGFWDALKGSASKTPVFVVGFMRSGSTLLETMLDAHPEAWGLGEDSVFNSRLPAFQRDFLVEVNRGDVLAANGVIARYAELILEGMKAGLEADKRAGVRRIVDKMLFNYNNIGLVHMVFPHASVLHMVRDPLDTLFSCVRHKFDEPGLRFTLDEDALVANYVAYLNTVAHFRRVLPGRVLDVRYEELVRRPERAMRAVTGRLGMQWSAEVLLFHSSGRVVQTHSAAQVRRALYTDSIGGWRAYAAELQSIADKFRAYLPELRAAGALVFEDEVNWAMDPLFAYEGGRVAEVEVRSDGSSVAREGRRRSAGRGKGRGKGRGRGRGRGGRAGSQAARRARQEVRDVCVQHSGLSDEASTSFAATLDFPPPGLHSSRAVSCAYALLNQRKYSLGVQVLRAVVQADPDTYQAHLALSTALGLSGQPDLAVEAVNALLELLPNHPRALRQRADIHMSVRAHDLAIADLSYLLEYEVDAALLLQRGTAYYLRGDMRSARTDLERSVELEPTASSLNALGKTLKEFGVDARAVDLQLRAIALDGAHKEAYLDAAIGYMSLSRTAEAEAMLDRALALDPAFLTAHGWRALLHDSMGRTRAVIADVQRVLSLDPTQTTSMGLGALSHCALGQFRSAAALFTRVMALEPAGSAWFKREMVFFHMRYADASVLTFNLNKAVHPRVKEGFATSAEDPAAFMAAYPDYASMEPEDGIVEAEEPLPRMPAQGPELLRLTEGLARWVQVASPGFTPHARHYRMFGLAVLHTAQTLRMHARSLRDTGIGLRVPDAMCSHSETAHKTYAAPDMHVFGWRDLFDLVVRWRQLSAPGDPVFWTDQLTRKQYHDRQGMTTYMLNGLATNVRYGPYAPLALNVTRALLLTEGYLSNSGSVVHRVTAEAAATVRGATSVAELHAAVGGAFFVVVPCQSAVSERTLSGTMIKLEAARDGGWDFGICTATAEHRYADFEDDLAAAFERVVRVLADEATEDRSEELLRSALRLFYFWVQLTPITRGASAAGYAAVLACVLALGEQMDVNLPEGKQLDWEGILATTSEAFIEKVLPWMASRSATDIPEAWLNGDPGHRLIEIFDTPRKMIAAINGEDD